jgi:hypothetical protein
VETLFWVQKIDDLSQSLEVVSLQLPVLALKRKKVKNMGDIVMSPTTERVLKRYGVKADAVIGFNRVDGREIRAGEIFCVEDGTPIYPEPCARLTRKGKYDDVSI